MRKRLASAILFVTLEYAGLCSATAQTNLQAIAPMPAIQTKINEILETPSEGLKKIEELKAMTGGKAADIVPQLLLFQMEHKTDERKLWGSAILLEKLWPDIKPDDLVVAISPWLDTQDRSFKNKLYKVLDAAFVSNNVVNFGPIASLVRQRERDLPRPFLEYMFYASPSETFQTLANALEKDSQKRNSLLTVARPVYELLEKRKSSVERDEDIDEQTVNQLEMLSRDKNWWTRCFVALTLEKCQSFRRKEIVEQLKGDEDPLVRRVLANLPASLEPKSRAAEPNSRKTIKTFELNIPFESDKTDIGAEIYPQLDEIAQMLKTNPRLTARIEGHTDKMKKANASYSQRLTERRAQAVLAYVAKAGGIETNRMTAVGCGFSRPKASDNRDSGNPENMRIEVYIEESP